MTDKLNEIGLDPLVNLMYEQGRWPVVEDAWDPGSFNLYSALIALHDLGVYPLVSVYVNMDLFNTNRWLIYVSSSELYFYCLVCFACTHLLVI